VLTYVDDSEHVKTRRNHAGRADQRVINDLPSSESSQLLKRFVYCQRHWKQPPTTAQERHSGKPHPADITIENVKTLTSLKLIVRTMWRYHSIKTAEIFWVTLDGDHGATHGRARPWAAPCITTVYSKVTQTIFCCFSGVILSHRPYNEFWTGKFFLHFYLLFYYISNTNRVIGDFVSNFVAVATSVSRRKLGPIWHLDPTTTCCTQGSRRCLSYKPSYCRFGLNFVAMATAVCQSVLLKFDPHH